MCICLFWLQGKDSNKVNEGDSRRAVENIEMNENDRSEAEVMNCMRDVRGSKCFIWGSRIHFTPTRCNGSFLRRNVYRGIRNYKF